MIQRPVKLTEPEQAKYIYSYLRSPEINSKCFIIEESYIDKDFLIDFANFYVRSFNFKEKYTTRYHFFKESFPDEQFTHSLESNDTIFFDNLKDWYQGFVVVKPVTDKYGSGALSRLSVNAPVAVRGETCRSQERE